VTGCTFVRLPDSSAAMVALNAMPKTGSRPHWSVSPAPRDEVTEKRKGEVLRKLTILAALVAVMVAAFAAVAYADIVTGTNRDDELEGTPRSDQINGLWGDDTIRSLAGSDESFGGRGEDTIYGNRGMDDVNGGPGEDELYGGGQPDSVQAVDGNPDEVSCGAGVDEAFVDSVGWYKDTVSEDCEFVNGIETRGPPA
jgi:hypothetical protein